MDTIEALKTRRCVRAYTKQPVDRQLIEEVIDCGRLSATAINIQPWEFVVVTDPEVRRRIAALTEYGKFIADAPVCVVVLCKEGSYYLEDGSAATQNILVAAHALGLSGCWVAGDKKAYAPQIAEIVGAPAGYRLISLVPIGYPAEHPVKEKRPLASVLHWERF
jgi:nitroreductase